jgi:rhodanese-related sulfurtransferase/Fe-S cluster assembly iron-binding protein IscA
MYIKKIKKNKIYKYSENSINLIITKKSKNYITKKTTYLNSKKYLKIRLHSNLKHYLSLDQKSRNDIKLKFQNFKITTNKLTANKIKNTKIYFKIKKKNSGFKLIDNNLLKNLQNINMSQLKKSIANKNKTLLFDMRNKNDWIKNNIKDSILLKENHHLLKSINKYEKIITICKYGYRSLIQAKKLIKLNFKRIHNLPKGIKDFFL